MKTEFKAALDALKIGFARWDEFSISNSIVVCDDIYYILIYLI